MITAQTLNTCFANQFSFPRMSISSAIRISDDLMNDKSYYFEEVLTIKQMIDLSVDTNPHLFLLDEIFKKTNTVERIAAGKAVLSALAKNRNAIRILQINDYPSSIIDEALEISNKMDKHTELNIL